jgi:hypothetical protein
LPVGLLELGNEHLTSDCSYFEYCFLQGLIQSLCLLTGLLIIFSKTTAKGEHVCAFERPHHLVKVVDSTFQLVFKDHVDEGT